MPNNSIRPLKSLLTSSPQVFMYFLLLRIYDSFAKLNLFTFSYVLVI